MRFSNNKRSGYLSRLALAVVLALAGGGTAAVSLNNAERAASQDSAPAMGAESDTSQVAAGEGDDSAPLVEVALDLRTGAANPPAEDEGTDEVAEHDTVAERHGGGLQIMGHTHHRQLLFTFDDGPDWKKTPRLLDMLDEEDIKAIFFLTSWRMDGTSRRREAQKEVARDIARRGHIIGNHTYDHPELPTLQTHEIAYQIDETQRIIEDVIGQRPYLFRPPGGAISPRVARMIEERGYTTVLWNVGTGDFLVRDSDAVLRTFKKVLARRAREGSPGGIILMHDTHTWTVEAFPRIVRYIRQKNCRALERGEELYEFVSDLSAFYVPRGDADHGQEAPPALEDPAEHAARQEVLREQARAYCDAQR